MLWIALHLPSLSLESFAATLPGDAVDAPLALVDTHHIVAANAAARILGVQPGQRRVTALALAPRLTLGKADPRRDVQALTAVAHAALAYTPQVSLQPAPAGASPHTVLMEVQASLRCFGGGEQLLRRLLTDMAPLGHGVRTASAPTAQGAALLAWGGERAGDLGVLERDTDCLRQALDPLPVGWLESARPQLDALHGMGLRRLADLRRLPRSGLARRFDPALLDELDRAYGDRPDPRPALTLPPRFDSRLELHARVDVAEQLLHGAGVLLARLAAWLSARHAFVRRCSLVMRHEARWRREAQTPATTVLELALAVPSRDAAHLASLLRERLAALQLPAPTLELELHADDIALQPPPNGELFPTPRGEREGLIRLIERLQARLGDEGVLRLMPVPDHRPERGDGWEAVVPGQSLILHGRGHHGAGGVVVSTPPAGACTASHPAWLLPEPQPLPEQQFRPVLEGRPLQLLSGPERIEAGWWDGALAERDYFIAQTEGGALVWVYRARLPLSAGPQAQGWFLQGRFG